MKCALELEKKIMLTEKEHMEILITMGNYANSTVHNNYYFDTDDLSMNKQGITCRIRKKNGKFTTTIKKHSKTIDDHSIEKLNVIGDSYDTTIFDSLNLKLQGSMITERMLLTKDKDVEAVLDRNTYLNICDYELEVEYTEGNEEKAVAVIKGIAEMLFRNGVLESTASMISRVGKGLSKSERFFQKLSLEHFNRYSEHDMSDI